MPKNSKSNVYAQAEAIKAYLKDNLNKEIVHLLHDSKVRHDPKADKKLNAYPKDMIAYQTMLYDMYTVLKLQNTFVKNQERTVEQLRNLAKTTYNVSTADLNAIKFESIGKSNNHSNSNNHTPLHCAGAFYLQICTFGEKINL